MRHPEQDFQKAVVGFLSVALRADEVFFFHPANGGARSRAEAGIFKAMGVKAGVPDLVFVSGRGFFAIELKAPGGGVVSTAQKAVHETWRGFGVGVAVCKSLEEVCACLKGWGFTLRARL